MFQLVLPPRTRGVVCESFSEIPHWGKSQSEFTCLGSDVYHGAVEYSRSAHDRHAFLYEDLQALVVRFCPRPGIRTSHSRSSFGIRSPNCPAWITARA